MYNLLYQAWSKALPAMRAFLASNPSTTASIAKRIGSVDSVEAILTMARKNPLTTALVALEAGSAGAAIVEWLRENDAELISQLEALTYQHDTVEEGDKLSDIEKYKDEMELIDDVSAQMGGDANLYALINVVKLCSENKNLLVLRERLQNIKIRR